MASVHIRDIQRWLRLSGEPDAHYDSGQMFLEIRFDEPASDGVVDEDMINQAIIAQSPQGNVTIVFDEFGMLRSLDIS